MTDTTRTPDPNAPLPDPRPPAAGERRLDRPPSERYRATPAPEPPADPSGTAGRGSTAQGIVFGGIAALAGAGLIVVLGGAMAVSAGLLVAAAAIGYAVGLATVAGAGDTLSRPARPRIAATLAGVGALLGQIGLWLFARAEGGVLPLVDYLGQAFGALVPLELALAVGVAWWRAR